MSHLGSEVTGLSLNLGGWPMDRSLFRDTQLGSGDKDLWLFLLVNLRYNIHKHIYKWWEVEKNRFSDVSRFSLQHRFWACFSPRIYHVCTLETRRASLRRICALLDSVCFHPACFAVLLDQMHETRALTDCHARFVFVCPEARLRLRLNALLHFTILSYETDAHTVSYVFRASDMWK